MKDREELFDLVASAEPERDELELQWVKARALKGLFAKAKFEFPSVGRFKLDARLGAGGMGVVYSARDPELDREVAIKLVRVSSEQRRAETLAEAQALARVTHPNVVAIHDVSIQDDQVVIVMEFVRGETLRAFARTEGRTTTEIAKAYRQAAEGLAAVHRVGLIHRDFKPDNAVIGDDGRVRVIDFGISIGDHQASASPTAGTPRYMSPEHERGERLTAAADQFALCASLAEALEAVSPGHAPGWLAAITNRGLQPDPDDRFADLDEVADKLSHDPAAVRKRRLWGAGAVAVAVGAFAIGATQFASSEAADACMGAEDDLANAWSVDDREAALESIRSLDGYGESVAPKLRAATDEFAKQWSGIHNSSCIAHERGEVSTTLFDRQSICLARQKRAFSASGKLASKAKAEDLASLAVVFTSLPSPSECGDLEALSELAPPPPEVADQAEELGRKIEEQIVELTAGHYKTVAERAAEIATAADTLGFAPLQAEAWLLIGRAHLSMFDFEAADKPLGKSMRLALASGLDAVAIESWSRRAWARGMKNDEAALAEREVIEAMTERIGRETFATGLFYNNLGSVGIARGHRKQARSDLALATDIAGTVTGRGAFELANAIGNLAIVTVDAAERDKLAAESVAKLASLVGADHPDTLDALISRADMVPNARAALPIVKGLCERIAELHPSLDVRVANCFYRSGWLYREAGAIEAARQAMSWAATHRDAPLAPPAAGIAAAFGGELGDAIAALEPRLENLPKADNRWWAHLVTAEIEIALGSAYLHGSSKERRGRELVASARSRLDSIEDPHPSVIRLSKLATEILGRQSANRQPSPD